MRATAELACAEFLHLLMQSKEQPMLRIKYKKKKKQKNTKTYQKC
jgi:hypothetical protein